MVRFQDQYFNYKGIVDNEDNNGLAIGAFKAAFYADTGAAYVYKMCEAIIKKLKYKGSYRDDGLAIFDGWRTVKQTVTWYCDFQLEVDKV
eukprot:7193906-Ditylum_brightwellii.AAC.1